MTLLSADSVPSFLYVLESSLLDPPRGLLTSVLSSRSSLLFISMVLNLPSTNLPYILNIISVISLALSTIFSNKLGKDSSSSGRQSIYPICSKVRPCLAALFSRVEEMRMFLRQIGRNRKVASNI
jgi:hypothetical protein